MIWAQIKVKKKMIWAQIGLVKKKYLAVNQKKNIWQ